MTTRLIFGCFLASLLSQGLAYSDCTENLQADIYILQDSSNSINNVGWGRCLDFQKNVVDLFPLGRDKVQICYGTFSTAFVHWFDLNFSHDSEEIKQGISNAPRLQQNTRTDIALNQIRENDYFGAAHGGRPGVPRVLLLITDGNSDIPAESIAAAEALRDYGAAILVVAVGSINRTELEQYTADPSKVISVKSFGDIRSIIPALTVEICKVPPPPPTTTVPPPPPTTTAAPTPATLPPCTPTEPGTVIYVVDASSSVGRKNFDNVFELIRAIVRSIRGSISLGAITYGTHAYVTSLPTSDIADFIQKTYSASYRNSTTQTDLGIDLAASWRKLKPNGPFTAIVLTDGRSTQPEKTRASVDAAKAKGIDLVAVGVGGDIDPSELEYIASGPDKVYTVSNYDALSEIADDLAGETCGGGPSR